MAADKPLAPSWFNIFLVVILIVSAAGAVLAMQMMSAGIATYQVESFLDDWVSKRQPPSDKAWNIAHQAAARAVDNFPVANGNYYDHLGRIYQWHAVFESHGDIAAQPSGLKAMEAYRHSADARPLWPYTWVQIAFIKLRMLDFDEEFDHALSKATSLGPWRPRVNTAIAEIGFQAWQDLTLSQRRLVIESWRRAASIGQGNPLMDIADQFGLATKACTALDDKTTQGILRCARTGK